VAPTAQLFSAAFDPLALIARFPRDYPALLESGASVDAPAEGAAAAAPRYDILPMATQEALLLDGFGLLTGPCASAGNFLEALNAWVRELESTRTPAPESSAPPFRGGLLVYLGYEIAALIEPTLRLAAPGDSVQAVALRTPAAWIRDRRSGLAWFMSEPGHEHLRARFETHLASLGPAAGAAQRLHLHIEAEPAERFLARVNAALSHIAAGDIYQANLSRIWSARAADALDPIDIYRKLRQANPGPFSALFQFGDFALISSSPERLVQIQAGRVSTRPIAGTRPRGATATEDAGLIRQLLDNEKERAEHVMLIDLERNDLGRVCLAGSVHVDEFMSIESYRHVHHIVSNVCGTLRADCNAVDVLRATFPGGTITGCPKVRCMQIIADLEGCARGAYTGSLGYISRDGSADFNILIRTISLQGNQLSFRAGAGIVADSVAEFELAESNAKAEGLLRALRDVA
jgi:anthranilate synthase component I